MMARKIESRVIADQVVKKLKSVIHDVELLGDVWSYNREHVAIMELYDVLELVRKIDPDWKKKKEEKDRERAGRNGRAAIGHQLLALEYKEAE